MKTAQQIRASIRSFAWDITVGSGMAAEWAELGHEPGADVFDALRRFLGRDVTADEARFFHGEWNRCLREASQP